MKDKRKKEFYSILLVLIIVGISLGYAALSATLNINGSSKVKNNTWDIHFDNIVVNSNSVELSTGDEAATVNSSNTSEVTYSVTLKKPGDFYEFTVDAVNAGTIDGMVSGITSKLNGTVIDDEHPLPVYLDYQLTYPSGDEIEEEQLIKAGQSLTYKIRLEFKKDIDESELPGTDITPSFSFSAGFVQADDSGVEVLYSLYNVLAQEAKSGGMAREYTGAHNDSFTVPASKKIYHWYASDNTEGEEIANKNNVLFGGFCWQMVRTTDTGGVKMIYAGIPNSGKCNNSGSNLAIEKTYYSEYWQSIANVGYMFNPNKSLYRRAVVSKTGISGKDVVYENGQYTITDINNTANTPYNCNNTTGTCSTVRYYYWSRNYVELTNGLKIEDAIYNMLWADDVNQEDSHAKSVIDSWYHDNMMDYTSYLENVIFCNNRNIRDFGYWDPYNNPSGSIDTLGYYAGDLAFEITPTSTSLYCERQTDQFSVDNTLAQLTYPIALFTRPEITLLNNRETLSINESNQAWLMTPYLIASVGDQEGTTSAYVSIIGGYMRLSDGGFVHNEYSVRPAISLKPGIKYSSGDGTKNNPYVIE